MYKEPFKIIEQIFMGGGGGGGGGGGEKFSGMADLLLNQAEY